jgi:hypothetical protein
MEVFGWCIGRNVSIGQTFCSFLRLDKNPGCFIREHNQLCFLTDYAYPEHSKLTCIHCVSKLMNCTLQQASVNVYAALYFNKPLQFGIQSTVGTIQKGRKSNTKIHFNPYSYDRKAVWTKKNYEYWKVAGVKVSDLEEMNVFDVKSFYINEKLVVPNDLCIAYYFPNSGHTKLYRPYQPKAEKFLGTCNKDDVYKANIGHSKRIITKSGKDVLTLKNLCLDWEIWAVQAEGMVMSDLGNFDTTKILFDGDETGIRTSKELQLLIPNSECIYFDMNVGKDSYEIASQHGIDKLKEELLNLGL